MKIQNDAWILSDTHFGHSNIMKYANRPFTVVTQMDERLIENWNNTVGKKDQVIFLGDFAFAPTEETIKYRKRLNGKITILLGNHDRGRSVAWWLNAGFENVLSYPLVYKDFFILSHEPIEWVSDRLPVLNVHGHVHEKTAYNLENHHFNVSVEAIRYKPILLSYIIEQGYALSAK